MIREPNELFDKTPVKWPIDAKTSQPFSLNLINTPYN